MHDDSVRPNFEKHITSYSLEPAKNRNQRIQKIAAWFAVGALASGAPMQAIQTIREFAVTQYDVTASSRAQKACINERVLPPEQCLNGALMRQLDDAKAYRMSRLVEGTARTLLPAGIGGAFGAAFGAVQITAVNFRNKRSTKARRSDSPASESYAYTAIRSNMLQLSKTAARTMTDTEADANKAVTPDLSYYDTRTAAKVTAATLLGLIVGAGAGVANNIALSSFYDGLTVASAKPCPSAVYKSDECTAAVLKKREEARMQQERLKNSPLPVMVGGLTGMAIGGLSCGSRLRRRELPACYEVKNTMKSYGSTIGYTPVRDTDDFGLELFNGILSTIPRTKGFQAE